MFDLLQEITVILQTGKIRNVLDLGAGKGRLSLFCANQGLKVTAVDNEKSPLRQFDKTLLENKNIEFISKNIEDYLLESDETFDLVLLMNVIAFIKKDIFLGDILQKITHKINKQGYLILSFFFDDDPTMQSPNISFYTFDDFHSLEKDFEIVKEVDLWKDDLHQPYGAHKHHIGYIVAKKNN